MAQASMILTKDAPSPNSTEGARVSSLTVLAPGFAVKLVYGLKAVQHAGLRVGVFETFRTEARQRWLYDQGRVRPGEIVTNANSALATWHGYALAADLAFTEDRIHWDWPSEKKVWLEIADLLEPYGLVTGASWKLKDYPHVQPANLKPSPGNLARSAVAEGGIQQVWEITGHSHLPEEAFTKYFV